ncbi:MAG: tRNA (cmo5U34)-methyltransferase [Candidatus Heimdallarchaeota archaeon LC_3]|nr:MAG: tRNA (cmo5U34)-methyltransferase [Candidatus Heimdallarchaeota archaeon LC_3]
MGQRLGIFDYLLQKTSILSNDIYSVTFTLNELSQELNLDRIYLDGWLHMAIECGIFELDDSCNKCIKTAPFVFYLLIDRNNAFYIGEILHGYYYMTLYQDKFLENFKTGKIMNLFDYPEDVKEVFQRMSASTGLLVEEMFSKNCKVYENKLEAGGSLLEVGCGFGFNLVNWANKYPNSNMVGIDIDYNAIQFANKAVVKNNSNYQIEFICVDTGEFRNTHTKEFDVIIVNQVLHEMETKENYRQKVFQDLYTLLKDDGLLVVGEHMIPDMLSPNQARYFEIMHKWFEVGIGSQFYDEDSFRRFMEATPFKNVELISEDKDYFWAIKKQ